MVSKDIIRRKETTERAAQIIKCILSNGPVPAEEVVSLLLDENIDPKVGNKAKKELGVINRKVMGVVCWVLS